MNDESERDRQAGYDGDWVGGLREKMRGYSMDEPEGLWEEISSSEEIAGLPYLRKGRRRKVARIAIFSASAAAALALVLTLAHVPSEPHSSGLQVQASAGTDCVQVLAGSSAPLMAAALSPLPDHVEPLADPLRPHRSSVGEDSCLSSQAQCQPLPSGADGFDDYVSSDSGNDTSAEAETDDIMTDAGERDAWPDDLLQESRVGRRPEGKFSSIISTDLFFSNIPGSAGRSSGYESLFASPVTLTQDQVYKIVTGSDEAADGSVTLYSGLDEVGTDVRHRQPVRVGVTVGFDITPRWTVGTGLTYSVLATDITAGSEDRHYLTERRLHYIGIPLRVSCTLYGKERWRIYAAAGGMLEKCISGRDDIFYVVRGVTDSESSRSVVEKQLQWSLNAAAGVQFSFTPHIGIYAEPGLSWFIDNGSGIENVYKDRPLNFNFECGLRFSFR